MFCCRKFTVYFVDKEGLKTSGSSELASNLNTRKFDCVHVRQCFPMVSPPPLEYHLFVHPLIMLAHAKKNCFLDLLSKQWAGMLLASAGQAR